MSKKIMAAVCAAAFLVAASLLAAEPSWNPADAPKEAEQDIRAGHIKFYWSGSIAVQPVGVPLELAKQYPRADAGVGCVVTDMELRKRQQEYARRYNEKILAHLQKR